VSSIDSKRMLIHIENGKGGKDRYSMLSPPLLDILSCVMDASTAGAVDQGSQFTSKELDLWAYSNRVTLDFSRPGEADRQRIWRKLQCDGPAQCLGRHWFP
jgi:hypothetical protein